MFEYNRRLHYLIMQWVAEERVVQIHWRGRPFSHSISDGRHRWWQCSLSLWPCLNPVNNFLDQQLCVCAWVLPKDLPKTRQPLGKLIQRFTGLHHCMKRFVLASTQRQVDVHMRIPCMLCIVAKAICNYKRGFRPAWWKGLKASMLVSTSHRLHTKPFSELLCMSRQTRQIRYNEAAPWVRMTCLFMSLSKNGFEDMELLQTFLNSAKCIQRMPQTKKDVSSGHSGCCSYNVQWENAWPCLHSVEVEYLGSLTNHEAWQYMLSALQVSMMSETTLKPQCLAGSIEGHRDHDQEGQQTNTFRHRVLFSQLFAFRKRELSPIVWQSAARFGHKL